MSSEETGAGGEPVAPVTTVSFSQLSASADTRVLAVRGELDISTSGPLRRELDDLIDTGAPRVKVDLSGVVFMDSSALSALVSAHERARTHEQHLSLLDPSPACAKVLAITGLDRVFDLI